MPGMPPPDQQQPDYDVIFGPVDNDGFFYDPRSFKHDFSDARYLGMGKYVDEELMTELLPGMEDDIKAACDSSLELTINSDRDTRWFQANGDFKQVRLVDIWYKSKGGWKWALFTGSKILMQGTSPFTDENGKAVLQVPDVFGASVDHDGDRYGFVRNLQSPQDEVNQRRSKGLHELNNRRIIATKAAVADTNVETLRLEAARADGIVLVNTALDDIALTMPPSRPRSWANWNSCATPRRRSKTSGRMQRLRAAGARAHPAAPLRCLQQAGIAELGPYMTNLRSVGKSGFIARCSMPPRAIGSMNAGSGSPTRRANRNSCRSMRRCPGPMACRRRSTRSASLDVDIILDEGPDTITLMQDTYDAISQALPAVAPMLSPAASKAVMDVLIETSPLPADVKKRFRDAGAQEQQQPDPKQAEAQAKLQLEQQSSQAKLAMEQQSGQAKMALEREKAKPIWR